MYVCMSGNHSETLGLIEINISGYTQGVQTSVFCEIFFKKISKHISKFFIFSDFSSSVLLFGLFRHRGGPVDQEGQSRPESGCTRQYIIIKSIITFKSHISYEDGLHHI